MQTNTFKNTKTNTNTNINTNLEWRLPSKLHTITPATKYKRTKNQTSVCFCAVRGAKGVFLSAINGIHHSNLFLRRENKKELLCGIPYLVSQYILCYVLSDIWYSNESCVMLYLIFGIVVFDIWYCAVCDIWYCVASCFMLCLISGIVLCLIVRGKKADRVESIYSKGCNMTQG